MTTARKAKPRKKAQTAEDRRSAVEHLITRLRTTDCRRCTRPILSGHVWGEPTRIDRVRLNREGEMAAILLGFKTFEQQHPGGRIMRRSGHHISRGVPKYGYVLAEHRCDHRWPAQHFDLRQIFPTNLEGPCPF